MAKLVSMKISDAERKKQMDGPTSLAGDGPRYPWGLSVSLDNTALEKLGIDLPTVGETVTLVARADVTSVSSNENSDGGKTRTNRSVSLQITDLCVEDADQASDAAAALYKESAG